MSLRPVHLRRCCWLEHSGIQEPWGRRRGVAPEANVLGKSQLDHLSEPQFLPVRRGEESDSEGGLQWSQECGLLHPQAEGTPHCLHTPNPSLPPGSLATVSPGATPDTVPGRRALPAAHHVRNSADIPPPVGGVLASLPACALLPRFAP